MNQQFVDKITQKIPELKLFFDEPMKNHTTFRIGGTADVYVQPDDMQLKILLETARETDMPVTVIGNGSNLLVGDFGIRGLVIEIGKGMKDITISGKTITASAGAGLGAAASKAAEAGLCGMEFASGIPGNIGGAVVMNAGAYGGEIKQIIKNATVITLDGQIKTLSADELELSYRHSCISENNYIVISAVFTLEDGDKALIKEKMADFRQRRIDKQPLEYPSAGSTFKRPEGYFAVKLIMDSDLAGYTVGGAQVSAKHCGFVINKGGATAADVVKLIGDVQRIVKDKYNVGLEPEVKMIGEF